MEVSERVRSLKHPAWTSAVATLAGYGALLAVVFLVLFVLPWLVVSAL